ncbi:universal stress protein E [Natronospira proteinivora]|uniref:Universal stress protein E n=1 Tax=Natronospira proteinivora TaxID=1807133 RepID=A0ABT1G794_9GAMM|nr:universal stress protein [Natronospira proteinivora]MCP1727168.1 universal stress protein E [Natronospira proteinivora]
MKQIQHIAAAIRDDGPTGGALDRAVDMARRSGAELSLFVLAWDKSVGRNPFARRETVDRAIADHVADRRQWLQKQMEPLKAEGLKVHGEVIWADSISREIIKMALALTPDLIVKDAETGPRKGWAPADWRLLRHCPVPLMLVQSRPSPSIQRVLAALDPMHAWGKPESLDGSILDAAQGMSELYQAELHVGHAMEALPSLLGQHMAAEVDTVESAHKAYRESQRQALDEACSGSGVDTSHVHQREGAPEKVIPVLADDIRADLLVLGTVNRRGLKRAVIGSTAEAILDQVGCDVLAVKPDGFVSDYEKLKDE